MVCAHTEVNEVDPVLTEGGEVTRGPDWSLDTRRSPLHTERVRYSDDVVEFDVIVEKAVVVDHSEQASSLNEQVE